MTRIEAVVSDFGGVLTSPLLESFAGLMQSSGISLEALGKAMAAIADRQGSHPLFELETGRMSEAAFFGRWNTSCPRARAARSRSTGSAAGTSSNYSRTSR